MGVGVPSPGDVVITPRVLDQSSFDDLAASLQKLIKQSHAAGDELRGVLADVVAARAETGKSSSFLQERLRVSVRMLTAFQTQIEHVESLLDTLNRRQQDAERAMAQIDERIDLARQRTDALAELVESAEVNITVLAHKSAKAAGRAEARASELAQLLAWADELQPREPRSEETRETAGGTHSERSESCVRSS
jgi:ABC-type transporter Mla subunit MlaD